MTKALVISGDAARGAFQAGTLSTLDPGSFDAVYGTSSGALNAVLFSWCKSPEVILAHWREIRGLGDFYSFNWLASFWRPGLFNSGPILRRVLEVMALGYPKLPVIATVTNMATSNPEYFNSASFRRGEWSTFAGYVADSASIPGLCSSHDGFSRVDGGLRALAPIVKACADGHQDITLLMSRPWGSAFRQSWKPLPPPLTTISEGMRAVELMLHSIAWQEIEFAIAAQLMQRLIVYAPDQPSDMHLLDFDPVKVEALIQAGIQAKPRIMVGV